MPADLSQWLRAFGRLQWTGIEFPTSRLGSSQAPVIPVPGDLTPVDTRHTYSAHLWCKQNIGTRKIILKY